MNITMIQKLVVKDWQLVKPLLLSAIAAGLLSLGIMTVKSEVVFNIGVIILITIIIGIGCYLVIWSVLIERKEYRLSFIMSLPVDALDYAVSKLIGGIVLFLIPWSVLLAVLAALIMSGITHLPGGLLPLVTILFLELLAAYVLLTAVAIITQSEGWTIGVMVALNALFSVFMTVVAGRPELNAHFQDAIPHWNAAALSIMGGEVMFIALVLAAALSVLSRRRCFL